MRVSDILDQATSVQLIPQQWHPGRYFHVVNYRDSFGNRRAFKCSALNQADAEHLAYLQCGDAIEEIL